MEIELAIYTALNISEKEEIKEIKPKDRYLEVYGILYYTERIGFDPTTEQDKLILNWVVYLNSECESYTEYDAVKKSIIEMFGIDFFEYLLWKNPHVITRTKRLNDLSRKGERLSTTGSSTKLLNF